MSFAEIGALVLGSAVVAAVISGLFSRTTTNAIIADQRTERQERTAREDQQRNDLSLQRANEEFIDRYVVNGLELIAYQLDSASQGIDVNYRRARRLRDMLLGATKNSVAIGLEELAAARGPLDPPSVSPINVPQSVLVPYPGDFMQAGLLMNRCLALADDFIQRYPWTRDENEPAVDRYLRELMTALTAGARHFEAAALVVRQMPPRPRESWPQATVAHERLTPIGSTAVGLFDRVLEHGSSEADRIGQT
jgi:hypothetical protein